MKRILDLMKTFISCILIFLILRMIDPFKMIGLLKKANMGMVIFSLLFIVLAQYLLALRWNILLRCKNIRVPFNSLVALQFLGIFFTTVLPTTVGGDIFKIWRFKKRFGRGGEALTSVFVGRVMGILSLLIFFAFVVAFNFRYIQGLKASLLLPLVSILILGILFIIFWKGFLKLKIVKRVLKLFNLEGKVSGFQKSFSEYKVHHFSLVNSLLISFIVLFLTIGYNFLAAKSLNLEVTFQSFLIFIPIIFLLTLLPFTINGWGIREGAFIFFFMQAGLTKEEALAIDILAIFLTLLLSLLGGFIYLKGNIKEVFLSDRKA